MDSPQTYDEILNYIVYKLRELDNPVADALVSYYLNIQYDEENENFYFYGNDRLSEHKAKELIDKTIIDLSKRNDGVIEVVKLQTTYELAHVKEEDKIEQIKSFFDKEINNLIKEITKFQNASKKDYDSIQIHKKIFSFLLLKTKQNTLNSLNDFESEVNNSIIGISSEREIYAILDNVLPKSGLPPFVSLSSQDKIAQLNDLCNIVMGIRLLNGEIGKGGIGLLTLNDIRTKLNQDLLNEVKTYYTRLSESCEKYSLVYENIDFQSDVVEEDEKRVAEKTRKIIIYFRLVLTYLSMLMDDLHSGSVTVDSLSINYDKEIKYLIEIVEKKSAISKEQAYPRFENLAKMYIKFQEQSFILDIRENVFSALRMFVSNGEISEDFKESFFEGKFESYIENLDIYLKREEPTFSFESGLYQNGVTILLPSNTADFLDIKLEYQGFCIVTLLKKDGLLSTGRPNIVAKYKDKYLVFSNHAYVQEFIENPSYFIDEISTYARRHPYLINLLNMTEEFPFANISTLFRDKDLNTYKYKSSSVMVDKEIQTVVHVHENGYIDPNYVWNEWDLKIQALQLADIMKKKTISCQTILSHFRRENETQVWLPKDQSVNTTVSKGTNLSIPKSYVYGLRKNDSKY